MAKENEMTYEEMQNLVDKTIADAIAGRATKEDVEKVKALFEEFKATHTVEGKPVEVA